MKFGSRSVDAILARQLDGRRPQLVGYGAFPLTILSPLLEADTDFDYCECPAIAAHLPFLLPGTTGRRTTLATMPARFHAGLRKTHTQKQRTGRMPSSWSPLLKRQMCVSA